MLIEFFKMHAQGNDYIYFDLRNKSDFQLDFSAIAQKLSMRNFGIGSDGLVIINNDPSVDAHMRIFNADGSEAEMCGSALRCVGSYLYDELKKTNMKIATISGIKNVEVIDPMEERIIKVNLGNPFFIDEEQIKIQKIAGYTVNIGNPHFVTISKVVSMDYVKKIGPKIENYIRFPNRTNVDFVEVLDRKNISLKFWERGSGATLACGTGTLASFFTIFTLGLVEKNIKAYLPGGEVEVSFEDGEYFLSGQVEFAFKGYVEI
ncbi:MAG: diaminopimelate epimerase [Candidatus Cloacimonetes bacterium]|nr:diaminopimelate epimerase [Candidatus Cloacimonadota bacterium]